VSVIDEEGDVLLVDWRAPAAAAFYRATAARPIGVARRRTLVTRGRELVDLDDEVLDADAAARLGITAVTGQGALLAALSRERSGTGHARHRRHHPGRPGPHHPRPGERDDGGQGGTGDRQDRRRPAPGRLPALRATGTASRAAACS
jgi:hypothetical protein